MTLPCLVPTCPALRDRAALCPACWAAVPGPARARVLAAHQLLRRSRSQVDRTAAEALLQRAEEDAAVAVAVERDRVRLVVVTLPQPWPWAVAHAGCQLLPQPGPPPAGEGLYVAVAAGRDLDRRALEWLGSIGYPPPRQLREGAVLAVARVVGGAESAQVQDVWAHAGAEWSWRLAQPVVIEPVALPAGLAPLAAPDERLTNKIRAAYRAALPVARVVVDPAAVRGGSIGSDQRGEAQADRQGGDPGGGGAADEPAGGELSGDQPVAVAGPGAGPGGAPRAAVRAGAQGRRRRGALGPRRGAGRAAPAAAPAADRGVAPLPAELVAAAARMAARPHPIGRRPGGDEGD